MSFDYKLGVAEWAKVHPYFWKQMLVGTLSFIVPGRKRQDSSSVKNFFINHYTNKKDPLVFDGGSHKYFEQLQPSLEEIGNLGDIIDLGCGNIDFLFYLQRNRIVYSSYTGFDFACDDRAISKNEKIYQMDFRSEKCSRLTAKKCNIFAINTFCYIENLNEINLLVIENENRENNLIILEPWPGLFWDRHFDGIWPTYRKPGVLSKTLEKMGWYMTGQYNYYLINFFGKYIYPMSYVATFKKG